MNTNIEPRIVNNLHIECEEMLFYTYLPVKLSGDNSIAIPDRLLCFSQMIDNCRKDFISERLTDLDYNIYLTAKSLIVTPDYIGGRGGWHIDGFGTNDVNYIWSDYLETEFCIQDFDLSEDCHDSMTEMNQQANEDNLKTFGVNKILRLDNQVHRCPVAPKTMRRTFAKVSFSKDKYDLKGNSHNYLLDYNWKMFERNEQRNHTTYVS